MISTQHIYDWYNQEITCIQHLVSRIKEQQHYNPPNTFSYIPIQYKKRLTFLIHCLENLYQIHKDYNTLHILNHTKKLLNYIHHIHCQYPSAPF